MAQHTSSHRITRPPRSRPRSRPGTIYIAVLGVAMLVLVLGLGGLASARSIARAKAAPRDLAGARWAALSALELGRYQIESDPLWRSNRSNGAWFDTTIGDARAALTVTNPNGALNRSPTDPVILTATATQGKSSHTASLTLAASVKPYTCLDIPLTAGGAITATGATVHASGYTIASNNAFTALLCSINADVEASLTAVGVTVNGKIASLVPQRTMPASDAFDYYLANGTLIPGTSLPLRSGARSISNALLTPADNPYGPTNAQGIYVIDAGNNKVSIGPCRIVGTLVIINADGPVVLQGSIVAEPAVRNFPCIMIRGAATIESVSTALTESSGTTPNYNPPTSPYPWPSGVSNFTMTDSYLAGIDGLVYVSGNASVANSPTINQLIVGGGLTLGGTLTLGYNADYKTNPPPGFAQVTMKPQQGSRAQVVQ